jgi:hypothetical protein
MTINFSNTNYLYYTIQFFYGNSDTYYLIQFIVSKSQIVSYDTIVFIGVVIPIT